MKKILLIGDSIRLSYREEVAKLLTHRAEVTGPDDNCRFSAYTLFNLSTWAPENDYDVIQWNNGQWDTCYMLDGKIHTSLEAYLDLQMRIAAILRNKTKRLIFATTTPVWSEQFSSCSIHPRRNDDISEYNRAVTDQLGKQGVEIIDLHSYIFTNIKKYISEDMVHLTDEGVQLAANCVANNIYN